MDSTIEALLDAFPKRRPPLSLAQQAIAFEAQKINREGRSWATQASRHLERWMHQRVAVRRGGEILEIGAGTLNHLPFEAGALAYDAIEPDDRLCADSPMCRNVRHFYRHIAEVPRDHRYDRIISVAVLEHLTDLPMCLARSALLLKQNGVFQAGIPSEGGFLWGLAWRTTTGIAYRLRTGLDYADRMRHEHVNSAREIIALAQYFFERVNVRLFPLPLFHLSFYHYFEAREPHLDRAHGYLDRRGVAM